MNHSIVLSQISLPTKDFHVIIDMSLDVAFFNLYLYIFSLNHSHDY